MGNSLIRKRLPLGTYRWPMYRALPHTRHANLRIVCQACLVGDGNKTRPLFNDYNVSKFDDFVPQTQHVNLRIVCQARIVRDACPVRDEDKTRTLFNDYEVQGYLAHKKHPLSKTLQ